MGRTQGSADPKIIRPVARYVGPEAPVPVPVPVPVPTPVPAGF